jgi:hypothetical protein
MEKTFAKVVADIRNPGADGIVETVIVAQQDFIDAQPDAASYIETWDLAKGEKSKRYNSANINSRFNRERNAFYDPQPFPSWTLDSKFQWQAPVPYPSEPYTQSFHWDEAQKAWVADHV